MSTGRGTSRKALGFAGAVFALLLSACASTASDTEHRYYTLQPAPAPTTVAQRQAPRGGVLLVAPVAAAPFYNGRDIAFSVVEGTRGRYQFSSWIESPASSLTTAVAYGVTRAQLVRSVASPGPGVSGQWLLSVRLDEIYHDARQAPGVVRLSMTVELIDLKDRTALGRRTITAAVDAPSHDAAGAVAAMRQALGAAIDELVEWVDRTLPT
jgi:cholesterol transport system auxiliary component